MKTSVFLPILFILTSCASSVSLQPNLVSNEGKQALHISNNNLKGSIDYYGDYLFHDFEKALFPSGSEAFFEDLKMLHKKKKATIVAAAHTTALPYFSTLFLVYNTSQEADVFEKNLKTHLINNLQASNYESEPIDTKAGRLQKAVYLIYNPKLKTQTTHIEYFGNVKNTMIRCVFWTADSNVLSLNKEADKIIKTLAVQWY